MKRKTFSSLAITEPDLKPTSSTLPRCSHGEALRFTRVEKKSDSARDFYACSANRDRKLCPLFFWVDEWEKKLKRGPVNELGLGDSGFHPRSKESKKDESLGIPAFTDDSSNSQFLFDGHSVYLIKNALSKYFESNSSKKRVLCIGTPTIHKSLLGGGIESVLLDEDERLCKVLPQTYRFNMFNGESYGTILPEDDFGAIVMDPPFQPELLPALFNTLKRCFKESCTGLILMAFPYFNARQVVSSSDNRLCMSDVRLTYRNHKKFISGTRSPVRLFSSEKLGIQEATDYIYCEHCKDLKHILNKHCDKCNACTTIAGVKHYEHCDKCGICVKPNSYHCRESNRCFQSPQHSIVHR